MLNGLSLIILVLGLSFITLVIVSTFEHKYDYARRIFRTSFEEVPVGLSDVKNLKGNIVSVQINASNSPMWILSGRWRIDDSSVKIINNSTNVELGANITMVGTNGTGEHKHRLFDFRLTKMTFDNRIATLEGTSSLTSTGMDQGGFPPLMVNIPTVIKIENVRTISISLDKKIVKNHFGESPIFGTVT